MKHIYPNRSARHIFALIILLAASAAWPFSGKGQICPGNTTTSLSSYPNTYFPASQTSVSAGSQSITLGAASLGTTAISAGDILLIIQMQGAQISYGNLSTYGGGVTGQGYSYLNNSSLLAGNMEYVMATNNVPLTGGTLTLQTGLINSYKNANYSTSGIYRYQVIRVPVYNKISLSATVTAPRWNGLTGGVLVLYAVDSLLLNGQTIDASGMGFRGGAGRKLSGAGTSSGDYVTASTNNVNGAKGEGIAGTPRYVNDNGSLLDNGSSNEGYPGGSNARGGPGNAGGGGTDGNPGGNNENSGGGGGGNGGVGGNGGNTWNSNRATGGFPGDAFNQMSPSRLVMGGGGGAGTTNDGTGTPNNGFASSGASGGGIVILTAYAIGGTGTINVNGASANNTVLNDGSGGAGAGGSVMVYVSSGSLSNLTITANGGTGGTNTGSGSPHGPGGGGGGGVIYSNKPLNASSSFSAGTNGLTAGNASYGSTPGSHGVLVHNITQIQTPLFPGSCSILPVEFLSVSANENNGKIIVAWEVAREAGIKEYIVEKSLDGQQYDPSGIVNYKSSSADLNLYNFTDNAGLPIGSVVYYRIQAIEQSGHTLYSRIVSVKISGGAFNGKLSIAPNPVQATATISFTNASAALVSLRLVDMKGDVLWQTAYQASMGLNTLQWQNAGGIPNGIYFLQCSGLTKTEIIKVLVNH